MPVYIWEGKTARGTIQKGENDAPNEKVLRQILKAQNIQVSKVKQKQKDIFENVAFMQPGVKTKDLIVFTRQFSTMIEIGRAHV